MTICSNIDLLILCSRKRLFLELIFEVDRRDRETRRGYKRLVDSIGHSRGSKGPIPLASEIKTRRGFLRKKICLVLRDSNSQSKCRGFLKRLDFVLRDSSSESKCRKFLEEVGVDILRDSSSESTCRGLLKKFELSPGF
jgi:hypothetical protein